MKEGFIDIAYESVRNVPEPPLEHNSCIHFTVYFVTVVKVHKPSHQTLSTMGLFAWNKVMMKEFSFTTKQENKF